MAVLQTQMAEIVQQNQVLRRRMQEFEDALEEMDHEVKEAWRATLKMVRDTRCCALQSEGCAMSREGLNDPWAHRAVVTARDVVGPRRVEPGQDGSVVSQASDGEPGTSEQVTV